MSLYILHVHYCDFCGTIMRERNYVVQQGGGYRLPEPEHNNFRFGSSSWDICDACFAPVRAAMDAQVEAMKAAGTLVGVQSAETINERRFKAYREKEETSAVWGNISTEILEESKAQVPPGDSGS